jgi:hypothetical protein
LKGGQHSPFHLGPVLHAFLSGEERLVPLVFVGDDDTVRSEGPDAAPPLTAVTTNEPAHGFWIANASLGGPSSKEEIQESSRGKLVGQWLG